MSRRTRKVSETIERKRKEYDRKRREGRMILIDYTTGKTIYTARIPERLARTPWIHHTSVLKPVKFADGPLSVPQICRCKVWVRDRIFDELSAADIERLGAAVDEQYRLGHLSDQNYARFCAAWNKWVAKRA